MPPPDDGNPTQTAAAAAANPRAARGYPDRTAFAAAADAQEPCAFFSTLPLEIRQMIYVEFWRGIGSGAGLVQHVLTRVVPPDALQPRGPLGHAPCISDHRALDERHEALKATAADSTDRLAWIRRVKTDWCMHWPCEELDDPRIVPADMAPPPRAPQWSPFLPAMLTCKRMYLECVESIYENLTFCFTDQVVADTFLNRYAPDTIRSVDLCINVTQLLTELYFQAREGPAPSFQHGPYLTAKNNPWARLCASLSRLSRLRRLRVWLDSPDLRPWYARVVETRFFEGLWAVRAEREFVLMLPELQSGRTGVGGGGGNGTRPLALDGYYLEGENVEGAPFVVERGPRPNKWLVHLAAVNQMLNGRPSDRAMISTLLGRESPRHAAL